MAHSRVRAESDAVFERIHRLTGDGKHEVERYIIYPRVLRALYGERNIVPAAESASMWYKHATGTGGAPAGVTLVYTGGGETNEIDVIRG